MIDNDFAVALLRVLIFMTFLSLIFLYSLV